MSNNPVTRAGDCLRSKCDVEVPDHLETSLEVRLRAMYEKCDASYMEFRAMLRDCVLKDANSAQYMLSISIRPDIDPPLGADGEHLPSPLG